VAQPPEAQQPLRAAAAYAIGAAAKEYFRGERDTGKIGRIVRDTFRMQEK
jgi:hypothetical protein